MQERTAELAPSAPTRREPRAQVPSLKCAVTPPSSKLTLSKALPYCPKSASYWPFSETTTYLDVYTDCAQRPHLPSGDPYHLDKWDLLYRRVSQVKSGQEIDLPSSTRHSRHCRQAWHCQYPDGHNADRRTRSAAAPTARLAAGAATSEVPIVLTCPLGLHQRLVEAYVVGEAACIPFSSSVVARRGLRVEDPERYTMLRSISTSMFKLLHHWTGRRVFLLYLLQTSSHQETRDA